MCWKWGNLSMCEEELDIDDYLENLIPKVNPNLCLNSKSGIEKMLQYRIDEECMEVDSSFIVREKYKKIYGEDIPEHADTIFNALNPLKAFCIFRLKLLGGDRYPLEKCENGWRIRKDILVLMLKNLDDIFTDDYLELRELFDIFSDLVYSFANMMPAPLGYNATSVNGGTFGKGTYSENNDYPYLYLNNLDEGMDDEMQEWLLFNMKKYHLEEFSVFLNQFYR